MSAVSVRALKEHLSEHLRRVQEGQRILVTDRGRPICDATEAEQLRSMKIA